MEMLGGPVRSARQSKVGLALVPFIETQTGKKNLATQVQAEDGLTLYYFHVARRGPQDRDPKLGGGRCHTAALTQRPGIAKGCVVGQVACGSRSKNVAVVA